ncbi:hypothetical protein H1R20_g7946, partial [Candolleomyces eurysporus]
MADYDLSKTIIPYLDRHLAFPLLAHLSEVSIFPDHDVLVAQYELAKGTNMVDYAAQLFKQIYPDQEVPKEFDEKRKNAVSTNERLQQEAQAVLDVIENPDVAQALRQDKNQNLQYLMDNYGLNLEQITALYNFGKFQYSYGSYGGAAEYLYHFRVLSTDTELNTSAHWGKLASDILTGRWDVALEELNTLRDSIDSRTSASLLAAASAAAAAAASNTASPSTSTADPALVQLHSRTWLVHWSLFVYFNHPEGRTLLLETFLSPTYLNTIQTASPWILRYLSAAAIISRKAAAYQPGNPNPVSSRVRNAIREVVKVIQMEEYQYQDPVTRFLKELYVEFDFEGAQRELKEAVEVVGNDFFLNEFREEFLDNARYLISEAYCRIHQKIDIADLSERLNLSKEEGEKWIVNLIRETRMGSDAKIDLEKNVIEINRPAQPVYQTIIEKTRGLALRTQAMGSALGRSAQATYASSQQGQQSKSTGKADAKVETASQAPAVAVPQMANHGTGPGIQAGGMTVYYFQPRAPTKNLNIVSFRPGFRMIVGNPMRRKDDIDPDATASKALTFRCFQGTDPGPFGSPGNSPEDSTHFPNKSHVAHPSGTPAPDGLQFFGTDCPDTHPVRLPLLFVEIVWDTRPFNDPELWPKDGSQPFIFSMGDPTGFGQHADYMFGWEGDSLQRAMEVCTGGDGLPQNCPVLTLQDIETMNNYIDRLPGCNPVQGGPGPATMIPNCQAPSATVDTPHPTAPPAVVTPPWTINI